MAKVGEVLKKILFVSIRLIVGDPIGTMVVMAAILFMILKIQTGHKKKDGKPSSKEQ